MTQRRRYSQEFEHEAVELTRTPGASIGQIARDLGINANLRARWRREAEGREGPAFTGSGTPRDQELAALRRELAKVKKERDFLRDAAAYFAKGASSGTR
jgi:transposase